MRNVLDKSRKENELHILCSVTFSLKLYRVFDKVEKYGTAWEATENSMV